MHEDIDRPVGSVEEGAEPCVCRCKGAKLAGEPQSPESVLLSLEAAVWFDING